MRTSNPALSESTLSRISREARSLGVQDRPASVVGVATKALLLLTVLSASAGWTWVQASRVGIERVSWAMLVGLIGAFLVAMLTNFVPRLAPITAPIYAVLEGLAIGGVSLLYNQKYHGLPMYAALMTVALAAAAMVLYSLRIVRATPGFMRALMIGMGGLLVFYLLQMLLMAFGVTLPAFMLTGAVGICISIVAIALATACIIVDCAQIESLVEMRAPARAEWYAAFGLMLTLVWLYLECLRLLSILKSEK